MTADHKQSCLNASSYYVAPETYLTVEEAVLSRKIFNVVYHTREAKIHDKKIIALTSREAVNHGSREDKMTLGLKYSHQGK